MSLSSALSIGRTALSAYQAALQVVGNNLANSATPGYARVRPELGALDGPTFAAGQLGAGVRLERVRRVVNESLQARLRLAGSDRESASAARAGLTRLEGLLDPLSDRNLGALVSRFFESVSNLHNNPQDLAGRGAVLSSAGALADRFRLLRQQSLDLRNDLNNEIASVVDEADRIASQIAELNVRIASAEAGSAGEAADLRNQRDRLLARLSEFFNITTREQPTGAVSVYIGSESLVQHGESRGLRVTTEIDPASGFANSVVRFKTDNGLVRPTSGRVGGLVEARDVHVVQTLSRLDTLAAAIIREVNIIHSGGQGLDGYATLTGLTEVTDPSLALSATGNGLPFIPRTGSFFIDVKDASGAVTRHQIHIDLDGIGADSSLNSIAADITANTPLTATVLADGRLQLTAPPGSTFTFADDTSGFLAAVGLNVLFSGKDSSTIAVNAAMQANPRLLAASASGLPGDGANALKLAELEDQAIADLAGATISGYYAASVSTLAVSSSAAQSVLDAAEVVFESLTAQREGLSGVNVDEEAVRMIQFQRAFEATARYMSVVDQMLQTMLSLIR